jgi:hypothetical protein
MSVYGSRGTLQRAHTMINIFNQDHPVHVIWHGNLAVEFQIYSDSKCFQCAGGFNLPYLIGQGT